MTWSLFCLRLSPPDSAAATEGIVTPKSKKEINHIHYIKDKGSRKKSYVFLWPCRQGFNLTPPPPALSSLMAVVKKVFKKGYFFLNSRPFNPPPGPAGARPRLNGTAITKRTFCGFPNTPKHMYKLFNKYDITFRTHASYCYSTLWKCENLKIISNNKRGKGFPSHYSLKVLPSQVSEITIKFYFKIV